MTEAASLYLFLLNACGLCNSVAWDCHSKGTMKISAKENGHLLSSNIKPLGILL